MVRRVLRIEDWHVLPERCTRFIMEARDVFSCESGRNVFVGEILHGPDFVSGGPCNLLINGESVLRLDLEGEMLPLRKGREDLRAVSTVQALDCAILETEPTRLRLR